MSRVQVDLEVLGELIDRMARLQEHVSRTCADVDARAREVRSEWSGTAAAGYAAGHERWRTGAAQAQDALAVLHAIASTAHANYAAAIAANRRMWTW